MNKQEVSQCPCCQSEERFFENLVRELKEKKLLPEHIIHFDFQVREGIPLPPQSVAIQPAGTKLPFFKTAWDICCKCGCMYSVLVSLGEVAKTVEVVKLVLPNTQQRISKD